MSNIGGSFSISTESVGVSLQNVELYSACTGGANTLYFTNGCTFYTLWAVPILGNHSFNRYSIFLLEKQDHPYSAHVSYGPISINRSCVLINPIRVIYKIYYANIIVSHWIYSEAYQIKQYIAPFIIFISVPSLYMDSTFISMKTCLQKFHFFSIQARI